MPRSLCSLDALRRCVLCASIALPACAPASQLHAQSGKQASAAPKQQDWVARSNRYAEILVKAEAAFDPENFSDYGLTEYDALAVDLSRDREPRLRAALERAVSELTRALQAEQETRVRQDLELMIDSANRTVRLSALHERLMMPWLDVPRLMFYGVQGLLSTQVAEKRRPQALSRLQRYVGLTKGTTSLLQLARERWDAAAASSTLLRPSRLEVERTLETVDVFKAGIRKLFVQFEIANAEPALAAFDQQLDAYASWVRTSVLPTARAETILPAELYAALLEDVGVDVEPGTLLRNAQLEFIEVRSAMQLVAQRIARERGLKDNDYRAIIRTLKAEPIPAAEVEKSYRDVNQQIEQIVQREQIVSLPKRPMIMRLATEAENAAQPAPHFKPPPQHNNKGEQGQFVLTTGGAAKRPEDAFDDFNYSAVRWTLSAHEGRPGHELQHSALIEHGVSMARSLFSFNSVNVEGWALYAEAEMLQYEPLEAQLIGLQFRLLRAARAMLDPMLNLGMIDREQAGKLLREEVVLSRGMTRQELDRYTFDAPGQAPSYFYGYSRLQAMRAEAELMCGAGFERRAFNDFLLSQGMLPPGLLEKAVREQFIPSRTPARASAPPAAVPGG
ncbi:MAG TPA: DUF885 domain-containing protein [Polyangiales bacterium]|nr:DUF885 domain-containing protein [Polyangiales bacterium]